MIEKVLAKKEYILYPFILILIGLYEYGMEDTIHIVSILYAIVVPAILFTDVYVLATKPQFSLSVRKVISLSTVAALLIVSYFIIKDDTMKIRVFVQSIGLIIILIIINLIFKVYERFDKNDSV